ncbi:hypothetical protein OK016_17980 [Vibrio chagasii]|nr:hypothetical protein [Vibrio chagasii]
MSKALFRNEINDLIDRDDTYRENGGDSGKGCADSSSSTGYVNGKTYYTCFRSSPRQSLRSIPNHGRGICNYTFLDTEDKSTGEEQLERYKHSGLLLNWSPTYDLNTFISALPYERNIETDLNSGMLTHNIEYWYGLQRE